LISKRGEPKKPQPIPFYLVFPAPGRPTRAPKTLRGPGVSGARVSGRTPGKTPQRIHRKRPNKYSESSGQQKNKNLKSHSESIGKRHGESIGSVSTATSEVLLSGVQVSCPSSLPFQSGAATPGSGGNAAIGSPHRANSSPLPRPLLPTVGGAPRSEGGLALLVPCGPTRFMRLCRVKDPRKSLHCTPRLKTTCARRVVLDKWLPSSEGGSPENQAPRRGKIWGDSRQSGSPIAGGRPNDTADRFKTTRVAGIHDVRKPNTRRREMGGYA